MTFQVVGWADDFTRQQYRDVILKSHCKCLYSLSDKYLGVVKTTPRGGMEGGRSRTSKNKSSSKKTKNLNYSKVGNDGKAR